MDRSNESERIAAVRAAFAGDPDVGPVADALEVLPGDPWRVTGEIDHIAAKRKAAKLAREALGEQVEDAVRLRRRVERPDQELAAELREALAAEPALAGARVLAPGAAPAPLNESWLGVMVRDAVVYLGGRVDRMGAKAVAEGLVWESGAVCDVRNLICHGPACTMTDREIAEGIRTLIAEHPELHRERALDVAVDSSVVVLTGELQAPGHRDLVRSLCWFVPGVREVEDRLGPV
jgi:hypothetical protein